MKLLLKNLPGKTSQLKHYDEYFNLITSIIKDCKENFVVSDFNQQQENLAENKQQNENLLRDKETYQDPNQKSAPGQ